MKSHTRIDHRVVSLEKWMTKCLWTATVCLLAALAMPVCMAAQDSPSQLRPCANLPCSQELTQSGKRQPLVTRPESFGLSAPVAERDLPAMFPNTSVNHGGGLRLPSAADSYAVPESNFSVGLNFLGLGNGFAGYGGGDVSPDIAMAVGDTQVVQWVDSSYAVFDKATGSPLTGAISASTLFGALSLDCGSSSTEQASVHWDRAVHRWLIALNTSGRSCVAVSSSADATGSFYLYAYQQTPYPLIAKWGVWSNAYYKAQDQYDGRGTYLGANLCGYNRAKMLIGDSSAEEICLPLSVNDFSPVPADIDSNVPPPSGQDELFAALWDENHLAVYSMHVDFDTPANSFVTGNNGSQLLEVPAFTPGCNGIYSGDCVPQHGTNIRLWVGGHFLSGARIAYWDDTPPLSARATPPLPAPSQHWYIVHDVTGNGGNQALRWYEFTAPQRNTAPPNLHLFQSGTFAPDNGNHRWTAAIARDKKYNILMGYSISSTSTYPSIAIAGRTLQDPLGTMEDEVMVLNGTGSEMFLDGVGYWGYFSAMSMDPDGCTFFYSNEYYLADSPTKWSTQIASAKFPNCH
jgi:hypothetical protein